METVETKCKANKVISVRVSISDADKLVQCWCSGASPDAYASRQRTEKTVVLGLHGWLAPLWRALGGAKTASWYYPVVSGLINLLAAAMVLLTVRAIYRARQAKKNA